jgi:hypothetical protein
MAGYKKPTTMTGYQHVIPRKLGDVKVDKKYIKEKQRKPKTYKDKEGYTVIDIPKEITKGI